MLQMWRGVQPILAQKVFKLAGPERFDAAVKHAQKSNFCKKGNDDWMIVLVIVIVIVVVIVIVIECSWSILLYTYIPC